MPINAVIYARYSSDKQTEQSIEGQLRYCNDYAKKCGYTIIGNYIDRAITGTNDRRPEFQRLISDSKKRQFDLVLVYKFDRFARNRYDSVVYKKRLKDNHVKVISVMESFGDIDESLPYEALLEWAAENYSRQLSENVKRGMRESAYKCNSTGGNVPLGYKIDNKKLVVDSTAAEYVKFIFNAYADGMSKREICNQLAAKGCLKSNSKPYTVNNITHILSNQKYIGLYKYAEVEIQDGVPRIIDDDLFNRVQAAVEKSKKTYGNKKTSDIEFLLFGKLFCGECGAAMTGDSGTSRNGDKHYYYTCSTRKNRRRNGTDGCKKKSEKKGFIEWYVVEQTVKYVLTQKRIEYIAEKIVEQHKKDSSLLKIAELEQNIKKIDSDINRLVDKLIATDVESAISRINAKLKQLELQKQDSEVQLAQLKTAADLQISKDEIVAWLKSYCNGDFTDVDFQRRIIDAFVNSIFLYDDKIVIYYNIKQSKQVSYIDMLSDLEQLDEQLSNSNCSSSSMNGEP